MARLGRVSIGAAIGSGFALAVRRPVSMCVWGIVLGAAGAFANDPRSPLKAVSVSGTPAGASGAWVLDAATSVAAGLGNLFVLALVFCAVFRAVLKPEARRFAYLRIGRAEGGLFVLLIALAAAFVIYGAGLTAVAHSLPQGQGLDSSVMPVLLGTVLVGVLVLLSPFPIAWAILRLFALAPMMVDGSPFQFARARRLSRGHVGALFTIALFNVTVLGIADALYELVLVSVNGPLAGRPAPAFLSLSTIVGLAILSPIIGGVMAVWGAPWARAYRDLAGPANISAIFD